MLTQSTKLIFYIFLWIFCNNEINVKGRIYKKIKHERGPFTGHVVGGVEVPIAMYPHVAFLFIHRSFFCGGSIISDRAILTAAHCIVYPTKHGDKVFDPEEIIVSLGSSSVKKGVRHRVCKAVPHKNYKDNLFAYDIGVLIVSDRIIFNPTVQKVPIAPDESWRKEKYTFTIAGFGTTEVSYIPRKLLATRMHYVDSKTCNASQSGIPITLANHMFCMIGQRWTSDCYGDSGSGVIWKGYLVGVVSAGRDTFCGADMVPSMYTNVPYFRKWIESQIEKAQTSENCEMRRMSRGELHAQL